jgi:hypothetical protein
MPLRLPPVVHKSLTETARGIEEAYRQGIVNGAGVKALRAESIRARIASRGEAEQAWGEAAAWLEIAWEAEEERQAALRSAYEAARRTGRLDPLTSEETASRLRARLEILRYETAEVESAIWRIESGR